VIIRDGTINKTKNPTTVIAYKASALVGSHQDEAAEECLSMDQFVSAGMLPVPQGYNDIDIFNKRLVEQISDNETLADHASNRSIINASDTFNLFTGDEVGAIKDLRDALQLRITDYIDGLNERGQHPFLLSRPKQFQLESWANVYRRCGKQLAHFHPPAWLSGVYYPKVPKNLKVNGHGAQEGALELGRSYYRLQVSREIKLRQILPVSGTIVLFPGYVGHNTVAITDSDETRISVAFNAIGY